MSRDEFLRILRQQLSGQMHEGKVAAHLRYYEDYIQSQVQKGRSTEDVLAELGDPRLIARTLIDTDEDSVQGEYDYTEYSTEEPDFEQESTVTRKTHKLDLTTWYGKAIVIGVAVLAVIALVAIIGAVLPFVIALGIILFIFSRLKKNGIL